MIKDKVESTDTVTITIKRGDGKTETIKSEG